MSRLVRWLGQQAEALGVEIYPGFAADEVLYNEDGSVKGIATKDVGIAKDGSHKSTYGRGIELIARQTLFAEGCRGSCSEEVMTKFNLRPDQKQSYGLGIKEVWEVPKENFKSGYIQHTVGYPLQKSLMSDVFGGSFLYHMEPNLVLVGMYVLLCYAFILLLPYISYLTILIGMVVGLDYKNTYLSPYKEFQRFKHHPEIAKHLQGGTCISYGMSRYYPCFSFEYLLLVFVVYRCKMFE